VRNDTIKEPLTFTLSRQDDSSVFGVFFRTMRLALEEMTFEQISQLFDHLQLYTGAPLSVAAVDSNPPAQLVPSASAPFALDNERDGARPEPYLNSSKRESLDALRVASRRGGGAYVGVDFDYASIERAERKPRHATAPPVVLTAASVSPPSSHFGGQGDSLFNPKSGPG
jgi:hypothetical protein